MKKLTIVRTKWANGVSFDSSYLLNPETGKMCCLGFECIRRGIRPEEISMVPMPSSVLNFYNNIEKLGSLVRQDPEGNFSSNFSMFAARINDAGTYPQLFKYALNFNAINPDLNLPYYEEGELTTQEYREKLLTVLFAHHGIEVTFVD